MPVFDKRILRAQLARRFLQGEGIEIGALATPLDVPDNVKVRYVDRMSRDDLYRAYPVMGERQIVNVDIVDNGETLATIPENSLDFIVANHFMEHCQDFLGTLRIHGSKLRRGGRLFYAIPDRGSTFDKQRPNTTFEHLVEDFRQGPAHSRLAHYQEWVTLVENLKGPEADARVKALMDTDHSIHFHAWDTRTLFYCLGAGIMFLKFPGFVAHFEINGHEAICLVVKVK